MYGYVRGLLVLYGLFIVSKIGHEKMRKVHLKVVLDMYVHADNDADITSRLQESGFIIDPDNNASDEVMGSRV